MRVAFLLGFPNPYPGAGWGRVAHFGRRLAARGHRVDVVGLASPTGLGRAGVRAWRDLRVLNVCPGLAGNGAAATVLSAVASTVALAPLLRALRPRVVVLSVPNGGPAVGGFLAARIARAKVVVDYRDEWEDYAIGRARSRLARRVLSLVREGMSRLYAASDLVVAVTPECAEGLRARGVGRVHVVPNGADTDVFRAGGREAARRALGLGDDAFVLVFQGALEAYYRLDVAVDALARLDGDARRRAHLLILGADVRGRARGLLERAGRAGLAGRVRHLGATDDRGEVARVLAAADAGLVPYDDDPLWRSALPTKFLECAACELPVLATALPDSLLARTVREHEVGIAVAPGDSRALSEAVAAMARDPEGRRRMGANGRAMVLERFDRAAIATRFASEVERLAGVGEGSRER